MYLLVTSVKIYHNITEQARISDTSFINTIQIGRIYVSLYSTPDIEQLQKKNTKKQGRETVGTTSGLIASERLIPDNLTAQSVLSCRIFTHDLFKIVADLIMHG
jgi:hypothetical protein